MFELSANIELLFTEAGPDPADRVRSAADSGIYAVEIWGSAEKDTKSLAKALSDTGVQMCTMVTEPREQLVLESSHENFLAGLRGTIDRAKELNCPNLVVTAGIGLPYQKRAQQHSTLVDVFKRANELVAEAGLTLLLENLNTRVDHPGTLLDHTSDCLDIIAEVAAPSFKLLFDMYHALTMGESPSAVLVGSIGHVGHVQIADVPGRGEPGSGGVDWSKQLQTLAALGYDGLIGLEFYPTTDTLQSISWIKDVTANTQPAFE